MNMSNHAEILKRASQDPEFRRKAIALLTKKAAEEITLDELPHDRQIYYQLLLGHAEPENLWEGNNGYVITFEMGPRGVRFFEKTMKAIVSQPSFRWISIGEVNPKRISIGC